MVAQDVSGIMASTMTLTTEDLTPLEDTVSRHGPMMAVPRSKLL